MTNILIARWRWVLMMVLAIGVGLTAKSSGVNPATAAGPAEPQDLITVNQRVSSLEQRLVMIESSVRRLEQQQMTIPRPSVPTQPARDPEVEQLRSQAQTLTQRIRELECALVHLDERTLSASMKEARRRLEGDAKDPCRLSAETPVKLSMRQ